MKNVLVNAMALRQVLVALNGAPHLIRELQVLRRSSTPGIGSISDLTGQVNPIDQLLDEFNDQVTRSSLQEDLLHRDVLGYSVAASAVDQNTTMFTFTGTYVMPENVPLPRLSDRQLGIILGMREIITADCAIYLCKVEDESTYDIKHANREFPPDNIAFTILGSSKVDVVPPWAERAQWTDLDLWKKFFEYFNMPFKHERRELNQERLDKDPGCIYYTAGDTLTLEAKSNEVVDGYNGFHVNIYFDYSGKLVRLDIIE